MNRTLAAVFGGKCAPCLVSIGAFLLSGSKKAPEAAPDPKLITLDVKPLGPSAAREIGTFSLKIGSDWKLAADIWNDGK